MPPRKRPATLLATCKEYIVRHACDVWRYVIRLEGHVTEAGEEGEGVVVDVNIPRHLKQELLTRTFTMTETTAAHIHLLTDTRTAELSLANVNPEQLLHTLTYIHQIKPALTSLMLSCGLPAHIKKSSKLLDLLRYQSLRELSLTLATSSDLRVALPVIGANLINLEVLNLTNSYIADEDILHIVPRPHKNHSGCPQLKKLKCSVTFSRSCFKTILTEFKKLSVFVGDGVYSRILAYARSGSNLEPLNLQFLQIPTSTRSKNMVVPICAYPQLCSKIRTLTIGQVSTLPSVFEAFCNVVDLSIFSRNLQSAGLVHYLHKHGLNLKALVLSGLQSDVDVSLFLLHCKNVEYLKLKYCNNAETCGASDTQELHPHTEAQSPTEPLDFLLHVELRRYNSHNSDTKSLSCLLKSPKLITATIDGCPDVTDYLLQDLIHHNQAFRCLDKLSLLDCSHVTCGAVVDLLLADHIPMRSLIIIACGFSDADRQLLNEIINNNHLDVYCEVL